MKYLSLIICLIYSGFTTAEISNKEKSIAGYMYQSVSTSKIMVKAISDHCSEVLGEKLDTYRKWEERNQEYVAAASNMMDKLTTNNDEKVMITSRMDSLSAMKAKQLIANIQNKKELCKQHLNTIDTNTIDIVNQKEVADYLKKYK